MVRGFELITDITKHSESGLGLVLIQTEMVDPAGVAFGVRGLAGISNDAVKCSQYVQPGKNFSNDYKTAITQLEILHI